MKNSTRTTSRAALRWCLALLTAALVTGMWASPAAAADNSLTSSTPTPDATVDVSPASLTLVFAQPVGPSPQVTMTCGDPGVPQSVSDAVPLADQVTVSVTITAPAPKGVCNVSWRVTDTNLQPAGSGSFSFTITNDTVVTTSPSTTSTVVGTGSTVAGATTTTVATTVADTGDTADDGESTSSAGPLGLFRLISMLGMAMLFGALVVIAVAWPEGVEYILTVRYLRTAWGVALIGTYLFVAALAAEQSGDGLGAALIPTAWGDLLDTTSGKAALLRILLVAGAAYVVMRPERAIDTATQAMALGPAGLAVVTLAFSRDEFGLIEWAAGAVHAIAMAVWLGGLLLLTRVVLAGPGDEDLVHAVRGFARLATPALWATVITGAVLLFRLDRGELGSSHGLVLIVKTLLVSVMVFVGVAARQFITQRVSRSDVMTAPLATRLRRALGIEALIGIVVLVLTSWLLALSPPGLAASNESNLQLQPAHTFQNAAMNTDVRVAFSERFGANDVRIEVITPTTGLGALTVEFLPPVGSIAPGMLISPIPLTGAGVAELEQSDGFTLNAVGTWTVIVKVDGVEVQRNDVYVGEDVPTSSSTSTTPATSG